MPRTVKVPRLGCHVVRIPQAVPDEADDDQSQVWAWGALMFRNSKGPWRVDRAITHACRLGAYLGRLDLCAKGPGRARAQKGPKRARRRA